MKYYVVDAFTHRPFHGNPAGVCLLEGELDSGTMQSIAAENNLAETAFLRKLGDGRYNLRWFTPEVEMDLCGHATLASAFVLFHFGYCAGDTVRFDTMSGELAVEKKGDLLEMDFPSRMPRKIDSPELLAKALGVEVEETHLSRDMVVVVKDQQAVENLCLSMELLKQVLDSFAVIVTAKGDDVDFVSRFFAPGAGIFEDPVTGSAHSTLIPFWAKRLGKEKMVAKQLSSRGGTLYCENAGDRVRIAGKAVLYLIGELQLDGYAAL